MTGDGGRRGDGGRLVLEQIADLGILLALANGIEIHLLRFVSLKSVETMQTTMGNALPRQVLGGVGAARLVLVAALLAGGTALGQRSATPYPSPFDAPTPQISMPAPTAVTTNGTVVEYPIARVNDAIIDNSDYQREQQKLVEEARQMNVPQAQLELRQKDLLRDMIDKQLLLSRGKELDINADSEVIRQLDEVRKQNHLDSMEELEKAVRSEGVSYEDYKATIKNGIITQEVIHNEVGRKLTLSAKEEQAYYDKHKQDFAQPEQVKLSEILIPTPDDATDAQIAQAKAKADEAVAKLQAGGKFVDIAKQYSGGPNADSGGDLGDFARGVLPKVLEDQTFSLKAGEWTSPIRTKQGYVVLQVTEHQAAGVPPLSAVEVQVQEAIYQQAIQPKLREYLSDLRAKAYIDIQPGFIDTGASPKETKPVFSATAPPPVKKKVEQKERLDRSRAASAATATGSTKARTAGATKSAAASSPKGTGATGTASAKAVAVATPKKPRKIHREKIRYGQAPQNSLPAAPEQTLAAGADQGAGATPSTMAAPATTIAMATPADAENPLAGQGADRKKTRFSERAEVDAKTKVATKAVKAQEKAVATPPPLTAEQKLTQQVQNAPLGLSGDTATKKKKKRVKGAPKERLQEQSTAPPAPKPDETPIPPKSVRDNGEPVVTPPPDPSTLPPVTAPKQ